MSETLSYTICGLLEHRAGKTPNDRLMIFRDRAWTWAEVCDEMWHCAHALQDAGLRPGDRVLGVFDKSPEAILCFLGAVRAGGIFVPVNPQLGDQDIESVLLETEPQIAVTSPAYLKRTRARVSQVFPASPPKVISSGFDASDGLGGVMRSQPTSPPSHVVQPNDVAYLNYTSGTTGRPKGAITTHRHILENARSASEALKIRSGDVHLCMFPIHTHPHEIFARPLLLGGSFVLLDSIHPRTIAEAITTHRITCMMGVTPMYRSLLNVADSPDYDFSSLRTPESGGMDSPLSFIEEFEQTFGRRFLPVWGSTETTGIAIATPPIGDIVPGSLGRPCPGYEVQLMDGDGRPIQGSGEGELWVRGSAVVAEYWKRPEETESAFFEGWYRTGDIARREDGGFYTFQGRQFGMMKVGGMKVFPLEIERVLSQHPDVEEAVVIGARDHMKGEIPKAYIVPVKGSNPTRTELRKHCQQQLPPYKVPRRFEFREELPRTPGGKLIRSVLEASETTAERMHGLEARATEKRTILNLEEELVRLDRRILTLLNRRSQLLMQDTDPDRSGSALIQDEHIQRVLDANEGPLYDDVAEEVLRQVHSATRFPGGK